MSAVIDNAVASAWNREWPIGTPVIYIDMLGAPFQTVTRSKADRADAKVLLANVDGFVPLARVIPLKSSFYSGTDVGSWGLPVVRGKMG